MEKLSHRIELVVGDITEQKVDAIVNAANAQLRGGGGVDGAIHRAAGPELLAACQKLGGCPTGQARITPGFNLGARYVIHAVGPVYHSGNEGEADLLASCYRHSLTLAKQHQCKTVALPAISCGVYGYPVAEAAPIALGVAKRFLAENDLPQLARWVLFDAKTHAQFQAALNALDRQTP